MLSSRPCLLGLLLAACSAREPATPLSADPPPTQPAPAAPPVEPPPPATPTPPPPPPKVATLEELLAATPATPAELARVKAALRKDNRKDYTKGPDEYRAGLLADLGDRRLALAAHFLPDYDLGDSASGLMNHLDPERAAPYLFASMPRSDRNVQYRAFSRWNLRIRGGERPCCLIEMHAAAIRCLEADTNADAAEHALYAIGLTGNSADVPILTRYATSAHPTDYWRLRLQNAAVAALARLGSEPHKQRITDALTAPVPAKIDSQQAIQISAILDQAAFSGDRRYLPLLCRHLEDPFPGDVTDAIPPMPAYHAAQAIEEIVHNTPPSPLREDLDKARTWCRANP